VSVQHHESPWRANTSDCAPERNWRRALPVLQSDTTTLRGLVAADAPSLLAQVSDQQVLRYISAPPSTVDGFRRFIRWTQRERRRGTYVCYGIVPRATGRVAGLMQVWPVERDYSVAEWGFVLGRSHWGTGLFVDAAGSFLTFTFECLGVQRLEARAVDRNGRGNGALRKLGATEEGVLRSAFQGKHSRLNHVMWSILAEDWVQKGPGHQAASPGASDE
jgi:ribosomal-protein-alanine N-acetyltransferase